jgi:hypothetical protein
MAYPTLKTAIPIFMGTGGKDLDVPPPGQERLALLWQIEDMLTGVA